MVPAVPVLPATRYQLLPHASTTACGALRRFEARVQRFVAMRAQDFALVNVDGSGLPDAPAAATITTSPVSK